MNRIEGEERITDEQRAQFYRVRSALAKGKEVIWETFSYQVTRDKHDQYLVTYTPNGYAVGLSVDHLPRITILPRDNGRPDMG